MMFEAERSIWPFRKTPAKSASLRIAYSRKDHLIQLSGHLSRPKMRQASKGLKFQKYEVVVQADMSCRHHSSSFCLGPVIEIT